MTKPEDYTEEQFLSEIKAIIKSNPDATNPVGANGCVYQTADGRHCVIGRWLLDLGLIDLLVGLDPNGNRCGFGYNEFDEGNESAESILPKMGFSEPVSLAAERIQVIADDGVRWGNMLFATELKDLFS